MEFSTTVLSIPPPQQPPPMRVSLPSGEQGHHTVIVAPAKPKHNEQQDLCLLNLSDEILSIIFGYTPPRDVLLFTACTCQRFALLVRSHTFWKHHPLVIAAAPTVGAPPCSIVSKTALEPIRQQQQQEDRQFLNKFQLQLYCLYRAFRVLDQTHEHLPSFLQPKSVLAHPKDLQSSSSTLSSRYYMVVCAASSTDHADTETLDNVLKQVHPSSVAQSPSSHHDDGTNSTINASHRFTLTEILGRITANNFQRANHQNPRWWSSAPGNPDSNEVLLFSTYSGYCILTELWLKPLRDPFTRMVVYTSRKIIIRAYLLEPADDNQHNMHHELHHPSSTSGKSRRNLFCGTHPCAFLLATTDADPAPAAISTVDPMMADIRRRRAAAAAGKTTIETLLHGQFPVYESPEYDIVSDSDNLQKFNFPAPGVIANVITITLVGKNFEQFLGSGYYTCVEQVDCLGIPLDEHNLY